MQPYAVPTDTWLFFCPVRSTTFRKAAYSCLSFLACLDVKPWPSSASHIIITSCHLSLHSTDFFTHFSPLTHTSSTLLIPSTSSSVQLSRRHPSSLFPRQPTPPPFPPPRCSPSPPSSPSFPPLRPPRPASSSTRTRTSTPSEASRMSPLAPLTLGPVSCSCALVVMQLELGPDTGATQKLNSVYPLGPDISGSGSSNH